MAITFPLALPITPGFKRFSLIYDSVVAMSASPFTSQQQVQPRQAEMWKFQATLPLMTRAVAEPWLAFFASLNGLEGTFLAGDSTGKSLLGSGAGTPLVKGASQVGKVLLTDGWTPNQTGVFLAGDYFQLGSGVLTRFHKLLKDVDSDGAGDATLDFFPRLRESPADDEALVLVNTRGTFRLAENALIVPVDEAKLYGFGFKAMEAI